jgi:hypothetical protein
VETVKIDVINVMNIEIVADVKKKAREGIGVTNAMNGKTDVDVHIDVRDEIVVIM